MKKIALIILLFAYLLPVRTKELNSENIRIFYPEQREQLAKYVLNTIQKMVPELEPVYGIGNREVQIYLTETQTAFEEIAGAHLPYWTAAVTIFPENIIVLKSPALTNSTLRQFRTTVEHEFIHLYQSMAVPLNITPTWFNEGLAIYYSQPYDIASRILLSRTIFQNRLIPLAKLSDFLQYNHLQAELAYAESASLIEYLTQVYGEEILSEFFTDLRKTKNFAATLQNLTDNNLESLELRWKKYIASRYRWIFLLDIQYIVWLIIPILVIIVYFIKGRRNKKIIQQWNSEEINNDPIQIG